MHKGNIKDADRRQIDCRDNVFAIDLLWLRVGKVGGTESFIRNLMDGMHETGKAFHAYLLVTKDNSGSFEHYCDDPRFELLRCPVISADIKGRVLWQNLYMSRFLRDKGITKCFEPIYSVPFLGICGVSFYAVIHDLQAHHFPQYFSKLRYIWMHLAWKNAVRKSRKVIAISEYDRQDILTVLKASECKTEMIYNPIIVHENRIEDEESVLRDYDVVRDGYFFCVTSLLPHKNVNTLLRIMEKRSDEYKLLICGVGGSMQEALEREIQEEGMQSKIQLLPFVTDEIRDVLYRNCRIFLFPSVFEGFGMPPVEALMAGRPVITTKCTSIPEVTKGEATYVDDPFNVDEWNRRIDWEIENPERFYETKHTIAPGKNPYPLRETAEQYLVLISGENDANRN